MKHNKYDKNADIDIIINNIVNIITILVALIFFIIGLYIVVARRTILIKYNNII